MKCENKQDCGNRVQEFFIIIECGFLIVNAILISISIDVFLSENVNVILISISIDVFLNVNVNVNAILTSTSNNFVWTDFDDYSKVEYSIHCLDS